MLSSLHIENIAVIKQLDIDFSGGFTVMTGETGAGKSIIIGSLRLLLGSKTDKDVIRTGESKAVVAGLFDLTEGAVDALLRKEEIFPDENGQLLLFRQITEDGRTLCKINGKTVPLSRLKCAGQLLLAIHGQHDTEKLLDEETHLSLIDRYSDTFEALSGYRTYYERSRILKNKLTDLLKEEGSREERAAGYRQAVKEIGEAKLKSGEDDKLEKEKILVRNAQKLAKQSKIAYRALYKNEKGSSAFDLIDIAATAIEQLSDVLPESEEYVRRLDACRLELEEIARGAYSISERCQDNPTEMLNRIEDRLDLIGALKKKYQKESIEELNAYKEEAEKQLTAFEGRDSEIKKLKEELEESVVNARDAGAVLTEKRKKGALRLEQTVNEQLRYLDLKKVVFTVEVTEEKAPSGAPKLMPDGCNHVRFLISANPGEPPKAISEIASGGELSRIMLALKVSLADKEETPTLIFDEIDTGISGKTSQKIGIKLREISDFTQVFCITHSAQVAACGKEHFRISKNEVEGRNRTEISLLSEKERIEELARIMGGIHITDAMRQSAEELLKDGKKPASAFDALPPKP